ncbi:MAG: hypothetical protein N2444_05375 [Methylocystis sp.]|nr:hypothetical protein [Methylocystis sp.]
MSTPISTGASAIRRALPFRRGATERASFSAFNVTAPRKNSINDCKAFCGFAPNCYTGRNAGMRDSRPATPNAQIVAAAKKRESAMDAFTYRLLELARPRHADPLRLTRYGHKVFSQNDEDGIIAEIFNRIGIHSRSFVEFGVESGVECNSLWLLMQGWSGLWIEANNAYYNNICSTHRHWIESQNLYIENHLITAENINKIIGTRYRQCEIDLLSIDIDYNDYWVWNAIDIVSPRLVVIEYNATWAPPVSITVPYSPYRTWAGTNYFGASLSALAKLGKRKGYELVGCCLAGANAFFVRKDLIGGKFLNPGSPEEHYEPARYFLASLPSGHPPAVGPVVNIEEG